MKFLRLLILLIFCAGIKTLTNCSDPRFVPIFDVPIMNQALFDRIVLRINQEGIKTSINKARVIKVAGEHTAKRMRTILICEDLIPSEIDPWNIFNIRRWTYTDFERDKDFQWTHNQMIIDHIKTIDEIKYAQITITFGQWGLPITANVMITPIPGIDLNANREKIEGIAKILNLAILGLLDENIIITDNNGLILYGTPPFLGGGIMSGDIQAVQFIGFTDGKWQAVTR